MSEMNDCINRICAELERWGVQGIPEYKQKLMDNSASANFKDFLLEGKAALMFREQCFRVTLREAPDLALEFNGGQLYAEVNHFRLKKQDLIDNAKMSEPGDELVPYGDTVPLEGKPAWKQVYNVAKSKISQYKENAPNILVSCNRYAFTPDGLGQDLFRSLSPDKGCGTLIMRGNIFSNGVHKLLDAFEDTPPDLTPRQNTKPCFHLVEP